VFVFYQQHSALIPQKIPWKQRFFILSYHLLLRQLFKVLKAIKRP